MKSLLKQKKGRGWHGNSNGHKQAGKKGGKAGKEGKGWFGDSLKHAIIGRKGGSRAKR